MFKVISLFLGLGVSMGAFGYAIDGWEAATVMFLYFGIFPLVAMPVCVGIDSLQVRFRRWQRRNKSIWLV